MMTMKVIMAVEDYQVRDLFRMFIYQRGGKGLKKQEFIPYVRQQLQQSGHGEFLISSDMSMYEELTDAQADLLIKWKLI